MTKTRQTETLTDKFYHSFFGLEEDPIEGLFEAFPPGLALRWSGRDAGRILR